MTRKQQRLVLSVVTLVAALVVALYEERTNPPPTLPVPPAPTATQSVYRDHLEFGRPRGGGRSSVLVRKPEFVLSYNPARGGPDWVSWNLNAHHFGDAPRCNCFTGDTALPAGVPMVVSSDYTGSGYDRGHMVRSEERTRTDAENRATFLLTNILPQTHDLNAGPWLRLEEHLQKLAQQDQRELYVVAGGVYPARPRTLKDAGRVAIPTSTWKAVLVLPAGATLADVRTAADVRVIAVDIPNSTGIASTSWREYVTTIAAIEAASGLDLFPALPDAIAAAVKVHPGNGR